MHTLYSIVACCRNKFAFELILKPRVVLETHIGGQKRWSHRFTFCVFKCVFLSEVHLLLLKGLSYKTSLQKISKMCFFIAYLHLCVSAYVYASKLNCLQSTSRDKDLFCAWLIIANSYTIDIQSTNPKMHNYLSTFIRRDTITL